MGIAHVMAVVREFVGHSVVGDAIGRTAPGAEMQLIDTHRLGHEILPAAGFHEVLILPHVVPAVPYDRGRLCAVFRPGRKGIGLFDSLAVGACDAVFVVLSDSHIRTEADPDTAFKSFQRLISPVIEVSRQTHSPGIGRPDYKAILPQLRDPSTAVTQPGFAGVAGIVEPDIVFRDAGEMSLIHHESSFHLRGAVLFQDGRMILRSKAPSTPPA